MQVCDSIVLFIVEKLCSDGEFNSLRNQGYTRPLSVFAIRSDVRSKYARMSVSSMKDMLTPTGKSFNCIQCLFLSGPSCILHV